MDDTKPFRETLGSVMVDVYVGGDRVHFCVHQKLLCQNSPVFERMFNGVFLEAKNKSAELPEDNPETFDTFSRWLYRGTIEKVGESAAKSWNSADRVRLYCFAEKYCIIRLADYVIDGFIDHSKETRLVPSAPSMLMSYTNTPKGSGIRLFMARSFANLLLVGGKTSYSEEVLEIIASSSEFSQDVFSILLNNRDQAMRTASRAPRCDYHKHGKDKECTRRSEL